MNLKTTFLAVPLTISLAAQSVVLPSACATAPPPGSPGATYANNATFGGSESRSQLAYDINEVPFPAAVWLSLQFRQPANYGNPSSLVFTTSLKLTLAHSAAAPNGMSPVFASNLGPSATTVYSGPLSMPLRGMAPWPTPWESPLAFSAPYIFSQTLGKSFVVDVVQISGPVLPMYYALEVWDVDLGSSVGVIAPSPTCALANGAFANSSYGTTPHVGASWTVGYWLKPSTVTITIPCFAALGVVGAGGTWGGLLLPINLAPFGAPGCSFGVSADVLVPLVPRVGGAFVAMQIPNVPGLAGQSFYDQGVFLDPLANALGIVTGFSNKWTVGTGRGGPGAMVYMAGAGTSGLGTGVFRPEFATTVRLN